jgi:hypothetical protein
LGHDGEPDIARAKYEMQVMLEGADDAIGKAVTVGDNVVLGSVPNSLKDE